MSTLEITLTPDEALVQLGKRFSRDAAQRRFGNTDEEQAMVATVIAPAGALAAARFAP
jgi:hypothetical protein